MVLARLTSALTGAVMLCFDDKHILRIPVRWSIGERSLTGRVSHPVKSSR
jgi:hypothetical protein